MRISLTFIDDYQLTLVEGQRIEICLKMEEMISTNKPSPSKRTSSYH